MSKNQKILLSAVLLFAVVLIVVFSTRYLSARRDLSVLKTELSESTARWKQINEEKLVVQKDLKAAQEVLRDAELTIQESEERVVILENSIADLEKEIAELNKKLSGTQQ